MSQSLIQHIEALNANTKAWVAEDPANRGASLYPTDAAYWQSQGIETVEQFTRQGLIDDIWDGYKDAYGIRPRHIDFTSKSTAELQEIAAGL